MGDLGYNSLILWRCIIPEGPEVKRIGKGLAEAIGGKTLQSFEIISGRYLKKPPSGVESFVDRLPLRVVGAGVHGKFIYWICEDQNFIWSTLGMTGSWNKNKKKHCRVKFTFSDGSEVFYNDPRNFGTIKFVHGKHLMIEKLKSFGPDMLSETVTDNLFAERLRKKSNWSLAKVLMDQSIISGVGNYVKADALWLARLSPHRLVSSLSDPEVSNLNRSIQQVLKESYETGGATIKTYAGFDDEIGEYGRKFLVYSQDYDLDGNKVVKEETTDGRTTWWVPDIQI